MKRWLVLLLTFLVLSRISYKPVSQKIQVSNGIQIYKIQVVSRRIKVMKLNNQMIYDYLESLGYSVNKGRINIVGMRGVVPVGEDIITLIPNNFNIYNDTICVFGNEFILFLATVDPGLTYTKKPLNQEGCAHLMNGQYIYKLGLHRGMPALVQAGPVKVRRDRDKDGKPEAGEPTEEGWFAINIHAGSGESQINNASAGCQVIAGGWNGISWRTFYYACLHSKQEEFDYYLIDGKGFLNDVS